MSVYYIASFKINYFIAQNLGNKAKPRDHDPPGYFHSQKYPGYEVEGNVAYSIVSISLVLPERSQNNEIRYVSLRYGWSGKRP